MWFLDVNILLLLIAAGFAIMILRVINHNSRFKLPINHIMAISTLAILYSIDKKLLFFYVAYILITYAFNIILLKAKRFKKVLFFTFSVVAILPFLFGRFDNIFLILGIAYTIFKAIDSFYHTYYGEQKIDFLTYVNFILFLPVFTSGPIHRYREFASSMKAPIKPSVENISYAARRIIRGFFKKVVLVALVTIPFMHLQELTPTWSISLLLIVMSYLLIYLDLSGYSDIAIGIGALWGIKVPENFKKPWNAPTMSQFWRSWHVSLSDNIREHIYVVVVKKKITKLQGGLIGFLTMIIMAMWHGFNLPYLIAGTYLGLILFIENIFSLTTLNRRTANAVHFRLRCLTTNFLFALNSLVFTLPHDRVLPVIKGLVSF